MSDISDEDFIPDDILLAAEEVLNDTLPDKSKSIYRACYGEFIEWQKKKGTKSFDEKVFLAYFHEMSSKYKSSSIWSKYSMIKAMVKIEKSVDISKYAKVIAYLKKLHTGHVPKKAKVFSSTECKKFLDDAPNDTYLPHKVALILGLHGACRRDELHKLTMTDVKEADSLLIINIPDTKNHKPRTFTLENYYYDIVSIYILQRPSNLDTNKLFVRYHHGKYANQPIGKNKIGAMPKEIATWLNLPEPNLFTGHSFRRSSATLLADAGADVLTLKRHGGWRSAEIAEGYVENSVNNKRLISKRISNAIDDSDVTPIKKKRTTVTIKTKTVETE